MAPDREVINAEGAPDPVAGYSHAVRQGDVLFCSGQIALDPETGVLVGDHLSDQVTQCMKNLEAVCAGAGTSLDKALRLTIYTTMIDFFPSINDAYTAFFDGPLPARAAVGVSDLPRGASVMIDAIVGY